MGFISGLLYWTFYTGSREKPVGAYGGPLSPFARKTRQDIESNRY